MRKYFSNLIASLAVCLVLVLCVPVFTVAGLVGRAEEIERRLSVFKGKLKGRINE